jgi:hypothetical protein
MTGAAGYRGGGAATDWHHHLLRGGFDELPETARRFTRYQVPATPCPRGAG